MTSTAPMLLLSHVAFPVTTLGFGNRVVIWVQGCSIRCRGCIVPETWPPSAQGAIALQALLEDLDDWLPHADGVTISGGEPFDQPEVLRLLLGLLRDKVRGDLLVYSGYPGGDLLDRHPWVPEACDVLISEPYIESQTGTQRSALRGSSNQVIHRFTRLALDRYSDTLVSQSPRSPELDVLSDGHALYVAGLPRPEFRPNLLGALGDRGYTLEPRRSR